MDKTTLFSLALKAAGLTMQDWIHRELRPLVSAQFVYKVLSGEKSSARVEKAIDRLIREQGPAIEASFRHFAQAA